MPLARDWRADVVVSTLNHYVLFLTALILAALVLAWALTQADQHNQRTHRTAYLIHPCPTEDSTDCYWFADVQGNGRGSSFIDIDGHTYYRSETP